jgi:transposase
VRDHDAPFIQPLLDDIGELFYVEELAADQGILNTVEHLALRHARSRPAIDRLFRSLDAYDANVVDGRASITKAVRYILGQREPLQLFLTDAAVPIHNNLSERALRVIALLRKNSLFAGTDDAAQRFAQLLNLLATCQMHGVNPESWLADVLLQATGAAAAGHAAHGHGDGGRGLRLGCGHGGLRAPVKTGRK